MEDADMAAEPQGREDDPSGLTPRMLSWVRNSSIYRLNQKMMTEKQLFDALKKKALSKFEDMTPERAARLAQQGIDFCHEHRFLDDEAYAQVRTASASRSGHSRRRIARDLGTRGVDRDIIEQSLSEVDDLASALNYARKRAFGPYRKVPLDEKRKAKEFSAFARNGYSATIAAKVLTMTAGEAEEQA